jgi:DNA-binding phage protein
MSTSREDSLRHEKGKALVRALHLSELGAAGSARALALHQVDEQLDRVARLLPDALQAGISMSEIARTTGISRPTLYELRARYGGSVGDLRLAILQSVITSTAVTTAGLAERLAREPSEIKVLVGGFLDEGVLDTQVDRVGEDEYEECLYLTANGLQTLEAWIFEADGGWENGG